MTFKINAISYKYNGVWNNKTGANRDEYILHTIEGDANKIKSGILDLLDNVRNGYILIKWNNKIYMCSKDTTNPNNYFRNEITYHPLMEHL